MSQTTVVASVHSGRRQIPHRNHRSHLAHTPPASHEKGDIAEVIIPATHDWPPHLWAPGGAAATSPAMPMAQPHRFSTEMKTHKTPPGAASWGQAAGFTHSPSLRQHWYNIGTEGRKHHRTQFSLPACPLDCHTAGTWATPITPTTTPVLGLAWNNRWFGCPPPVWDTTTKGLSEETWSSSFRHWKGIGTNSSLHTMTDSLWLCLSNYPTHEEYGSFVKSFEKLSCHCCLKWASGSLKKKKKTKYFSLIMFNIHLDFIIKSNYQSICRYVNSASQDCSVSTVK